jgi:predicted DNA-binding transcriptional regulator AlpA
MATRRRATDIKAEWLADVDVAFVLGVHKSTIWRWTDAGLIPKPRRIGRRTVWLRQDIELFSRCKSFSEYLRLKQQTER